MSDLGLLTSCDCGICLIIVDRWRVPVEYVCFMLTDDVYLLTYARFILNNDVYMKIMSGLCRLVTCICGMCLVYDDAYMLSMSGLC